MMESFAMTAATPPKACHNCRRSRRRCDKSIPACSKCRSTNQICLGYGKLLRWTNSIASRGKMMGKSFSVFRESDHPPMRSSGFSSTLVTGTKAANPQQVENDWVFGSSSSWCCRIVDPVFQDLSRDSRFYLHYYDTQVCQDFVLHDLPKQNPFRDLLPLCGNHPVLRNIIIANSALRLANMTEGGLMTKRIPSSGAYRDALVAKHKALRLLSEALANSESVKSDIVMASIMLFIKFELLDSGRNGWRFHTDGARQMMAYLRQNGKSESSTLDSVRKCLISNCAVYDILGTTLTAPGSVEEPDLDFLDIASADIEEQVNSCLSCPPLLLHVIRDVSHCFGQRYLEGRIIKESNHLLSLVDAFDPHTWVGNLQHISSSFDPEKRVHIGFAYRAAVKIYVLRTTEIPSPAPFMLEPLEDLVSEILDHLKCIPPHDPFFKATCWPSFIAGAETNNGEQRSWISTRLELGLQTLPWGFLSNAIGLLHRVWENKNNEKSGIGWLISLKLSENEWLIA